MLLTIILSVFLLVLLTGIIILFKKNQILSSFQGLSLQNEELKQQLTEIKSERDNLLKENSILQREVGQLSGQKKSEEELTKHLEKTFKATSSDILRTQTDDFQKLSSEKLDHIIKPFRENIDKFERTIKDDFSKLGKDIIHLQSTSTKVGEQANNLAEALKGKKKMQGNWGEKILLSVLEASGLQEGRDYTTQKSISNENNERIQPDVIINLPDGKHIFVDSKFSFESYQNYYNSVSEEEKKSSLKILVDNTKKHSTDLTKYFNQKDKNIPEVIFMFVPLDFISILIDEEPNLLDTTWKNKIAIVAPNTLLSSLKMVDYLWKLEKQNKNTQEIITQATNLYDKFRIFNDSLLKLEKNFSDASKNFEETIKLSSTGHGNLIARFEKMREIGGLPVKKAISQTKQIKEEKEIPPEPTELDLR